MPSVYQLKPAFQDCLRPLVNVLAVAGVTANQVTLTAIALSVGVGIICLTRGQNHWIWGIVPVTLVLRMGLNAMDGMLAREHGQKSKRGALLNELGDVGSDTALYLPWLVLMPSLPSVALLCLVVALAVMTEMTGVLAQVIDGDRRYDGPMGKSDRAVVFSGLAILQMWGISFDQWWFVIWGAMIILLLLTILNRSQSARVGGSADNT